jgi:hypothetical protein
MGDVGVATSADANSTVEPHSQNMPKSDNILSLIYSQNYAF